MQCKFYLAMLLYNTKHAREIVCLVELGKCTESQCIDEPYGDCESRAAEIHRYCTRESNRRFATTHGVPQHGKAFRHSVHLYIAEDEGLRPTASRKDHKFYQRLIFASGVETNRHVFGRSKLIKNRRHSSIRLGSNAGLLGQ